MSPATSTPPHPVDAPDADSAPMVDAAPAPTDAPTTRTLGTRTRFKSSRWRPAICCAGALGIGLSLAPLCLKPQDKASDAGAEILSPAEIVLPGESTLIVSPTLPPGALLRGQIRLVADVMGRARASGEVARHLVESGARVRRGDAVLEISSGGATRTVLPAESRQNVAEHGQIEAADAQTALAQKMGAAQTRLRLAQERVARSQVQVSAARNIVRRLQNGALVSPGELPLPFRAQTPQIEPFNPVQPKKRRVRRAARLETGSAQGPARIAARQAEAAREAAKASARDLQVAQKTLADAQNSAREADEKAQGAIKNVADVEARFSAKKASGADVEAARSAQAETQQALSSAGKAVLASKAEVTKRESSARSSQEYADSSAAQAAKTLSAARPDLPPGDEPVARGGEGAEPETTDQSRAPRRAPSRVTLDQAIRFASAALDESRRASRDAERIHAQIEGYQSQVTHSQSRVEAATQDLVSAQQKVLDSVPRPRFTTSYAPADGVLLWISRLAREVSVGQPVFGVARGEKVAAHFEDTSGLWRALKKDATLPAFVVDNTRVQAPQAPDAALQTGNAADKNRVNKRVVASSPGAPDEPAPDAGFPVQVKITEIQSPAGDGEPAVLSAEVRAAPGTGGAAPFKAGAGVWIPLPRPHQKATLSVPASALVQRGNESFLAVLSPLEKKMPAKTVGLEGADSTKNEADPSTVEAKDGAPQAMNGQVPEEPQTFRLRWQRVQTGRSDGLRLEITAGLKAGMRVITLPEQLEAMGFEPQANFAPKPDGSEGTAPIPNAPAAGATPGGSAVSDVAMPSQILVRLTKVST